MPRITIIRANQVYQPPLPKPGYVYLVRMPTGIYKIGCTSDPDRRLYALRNKFGQSLELLHLIPCADYGRAEQSLHKRYWHRHVAHERFNLSDSDIDEIKAIERM